MVLYLQCTGCLTQEMVKNMQAINYRSKKKSTKLRIVHLKILKLEIT